MKIETIKTAIKISDYADLEGWGLDAEIQSIFGKEIIIGDEVTFQADEDKCRWCDYECGLFYLNGYVVVDITTKSETGAEVTEVYRYPVELPIVIFP